MEAVESSVVVLTIFAISWNLYQLTFFVTYIRRDDDGDAPEGKDFT